MLNFLCAVLDLVPGLTANGVFPEDCPAVDSNFPAFATVVIAVIAGIFLYFRSG